MILYGKPVAEKIYEILKDELGKLKQKNLRPTMAVVLVGEAPASLSYIKIKEKIANRLGIGYKLFHLPGMSRQQEVAKLIEELNQNKYISGIIIQLPLPDDFDTERILQKIISQKDIDGFNGGFPSPTARAILEILKFYKISLEDKKIVIVGYGRLVGRPLARLLKKQGFRPIVCDSKTRDLKRKTIKAEILITATGRQGLIKPDMVNKEAVVIDAGTSEAGGKLVGDVDPAVWPKVKAYSPVPGGVGPVTVACLMRNVVEAAKVTKKSHFVGAIKTVKNA